MKKTVLFIFLFALSLSAQSAERIYKASTLAQPLSTVGASSRGAALGAGYVAIARGGEATLWNPGGLAGSVGLQFGLHHNVWLVDTFQDTLNVSKGLGDWGVLGLLGQYSGYGEFEVRDAGGNLVGETSAFDYSIAGAWAWRAHPRVGLGFKMKAEGIHLAGQSEATASVDLGVHWRLPLYELQMGLVYANLSTPLDDVLQTSAIRAGLARAFGGEKLKITPMLGFTAEAGETNRFSAGLEAEFLQALWLRASLTRMMVNSVADGVQGLGLGMGLAIAAARIDYTWLPFGELGTAHRFGLSWVLGTSVKPKADKRPLSLVKPVKVEPRLPVVTPPAVADSGGDTSTSVAPAANPDRLRVLFSVDENAAGEIDGLEAGLLKKIEADPADFRAWDLLGRHYFKQGKKAQAIQAFEERLRLKPEAGLEKWLEGYR